MKKIIAVLFLSCFCCINLYAAELNLQWCKDTVDKAVEVIEAEGTAAFEKINDANGEFVFDKGKGYVFVNDLEGMTVAHIKPQIVGKNMMDLADVNGFPFIATFIEVALDHGSGWVPYYWPKTGEQTASLKFSYVRLASVNGEDYMVGSGMFDITKEDISSIYPDDFIHSGEF